MKSWGLGPVKDQVPLVLIYWQRYRPIMFPFESDSVPQGRLPVAQDFILGIGFVNDQVP
jgi:hypothetical protein